MAGSEGEEAGERMICHCGHAQDEHGNDPMYPGGGSTSCAIEACDCIAFEENPEAQERAK